MREMRSPYRWIGLTVFGWRYRLELPERGYEIMNRFVRSVRIDLELASG